MCGLYEAELLATLMLRYWQHPLAADEDAVNHLVETAAEVLARSQKGERFFQDMRPEDMNFVAAIWYAESCQVDDSSATEMVARREWLTKVRRALPACFCDPSDLA
jgi:hypothetical protein